jgi:hypothetical protein
MECNILSAGPPAIGGTGYQPDGSPLPPQPPQYDTDGELESEYCAMIAVQLRPPQQ